MNGWTVPCGTTLLRATTEPEEPQPQEPPRPWLFVPISTGRAAHCRWNAPEDSSGLGLLTQKQSAAPRPVVQPAFRQRISTYWSIPPRSKRERRRYSLAVRTINSSKRAGSPCVRASVDASHKVDDMRG